MAGLNQNQGDRLTQQIHEIDQLLTEVDEEGAEVILDELYILITTLFERFPQLDKDED